MSSQPENYFAAAFSLAFVAGRTQARADVSSFDSVSTLPIASTVAAADASMLPALLAAAGAAFVVKHAEASAYSALYTLARSSDGKCVRVQIAGRGMDLPWLAAGTVVTAKPIRTGVVLSVAGDPIAFVPNALGRALLRADQVKA
jgi:hypothetical protein